jgi:hypothetical protein
MMVTRFGLQIPRFDYPGIPDNRLFERIAAIATTAETAGFDSLWVMDHFYQIGTVGARTDPMLEAYTLLSALAARTDRARLGAMVTGVTYRNPALLAKMVPPPGQPRWATDPHRRQWRAPHPAAGRPVRGRLQRVRRPRHHPPQAAGARTPL